MKKLLIVLAILFCFSAAFVTGFETDVESASTSAIVLSFSGFNEVVEFEDVTATVETSAFTDTYSVDFSLAAAGDVFLLSVNVEDIFADYDESQIQSITVSGLVDGDEFAKRVSYRGSQGAVFGAPQLAPEQDRVTYWVTGIILILVLLVFVYLLVKEGKRVNKPERKVKRRKTTKKKTNKKKSTSRKKTTKRKKTSKKKVSKRKKSTKRKTRKR